MKRITLLGIISLLFIFACYEDNHPTNNTENENVQIEKFMKRNRGNAPLYRNTFYIRIASLAPRMS